MRKKNNETSPVYSEPALRLIDAAERLFGERGLDGVSLREVAASAKHANNSAVQHHFGTKAQLLQAVYDRRLGAFDTAIAARMEAADAAGNGTVRDLLAAMLLPVLDAVDDRGQLGYARFLNRLMSIDPAHHPGLTTRVRTPAANEIYRRLKKLLPTLPRDVFELRFRLVCNNFLYAVAERESLNTFCKRPLSRNRYINNAITMAAAALSAPLH